MTAAPARALITGGGGFVGQWLGRLLARRGVEVVLAGIGSAPAGLGEIGGMWYDIDIRKGAALRQLVRDLRPTSLYHLAGISFPPDADDSAAETYEVNVGGAINVLDAVRAARGGEGERDAPDPTVLIVGSGTQYGAHPAGSMPLTEDAPQRPLSVYAASKAAQEIAALQSVRAHGLRVICTRSFNHSGVGHAPQYVIPSLVRRAFELKRAEPGSTASIVIGNDTVRDYLHVEDAVAAYVALVERGQPGEVYNVCSGVGVSVSELARHVLLRMGLAPDISSAPSLARSTDVPELVGSPAKLIAATGWAPRRNHLDIIDDLIHAATQ